MFHFRISWEIKLDKFKGFGFAVTAISATLMGHIAIADPVTGSWIVNSSVSQLDGSGQYAANLTSTNTIPNLIGAPDHAVLVVRCKGNALEAYVNWPPFIGDSDVEAQWKFDDGPIWKQSWAPSSDGTATFIRTPRDFLSNMGKAKRLIIDVPPYQRDNVEAVFDLGDPSQIVSAAIQMCPA